MACATGRAVTPLPQIAHALHVSQPSKAGQAGSKLKGAAGQQLQHADGAAPRGAAPAAVPPPHVVLEMADLARPHGPAGTQPHAAAGGGDGGGKAGVDTAHTLTDDGAAMEPAAAAAAHGAAGAAGAAGADGADGAGQASRTAAASSSRTPQPQHMADAARAVAVAVTAAVDAAAADGAAAGARWFAGLEDKVAAPLVAVQASLVRDTVQWERGLLATPPVSALRCARRSRGRHAAERLAGGTRPCCVCVARTALPTRTSRNICMHDQACTRCCITATPCGIGHCRMQAAWFTPGLRFKWRHLTSRLVPSRPQ